MSVAITEEMRQRAVEEAHRRAPDMVHHFQVAHFNEDDQNMVGFLGEFACCELLGLDWRQNIRPDYHTIDTGDIVWRGATLDVKTETVPANYVHRVSERQVDDDRLYGRRLINEGQAGLLYKYDYVVFGVFNRDDLSQWYPIGFLDTETIQRDYEPTRQRPDGGRYPFAGLPVRTSALRPIEELFEI